MSLDLTTLRLLKYRDKYAKLARAVPANAIDSYTKVLLDDFGAWFKEFGDEPVIRIEPFMMWFKGFRHPTLKGEAVDIFTQHMRAVVAEDVSKGVEEGIGERLLEAATAAKITTLLEKYAAGDEVNLYLGMRDINHEHEMATIRKPANPQELTPIEQILEAEANDEGFSFRNPEMNRCIKPLRGGDFLGFAARPDKGKSSWVADNVTHMAAQVDLLYPGENRSWIWCNNEGPSRNIVSRTFQAALGATTEEMVALMRQPATEEGYRHLLHQQYVKAIGGRGGALRVFSIHDRWSHEVEELLDRTRPAGIVFDMVDNIKFGGAASNNGQRTDQLLEAMYQWARLKAVQYDCPVIATSQISADGDGLQYPTLPMLKDSKTGKQGAMDVIITMGAVNDPTLANSRYFGTTKNKRKRTGMPGSPNVEMYFDADRSRFYVPKES